MRNNRQDNPNPLLNLAGKGLKYLLLTISGFAIAIVVFNVFGAWSIVTVLLSLNIWIWFIRAAISLFCMFAIAMIFESWS
ncbi:hypothetical protein PN497_09465 [Sphaerospermopsis kisseleviana CS-549]|jgi:hypothetical protein|uniref:Uncharacterized protein n=2 Tax=Sphaerospermopsis TaxID=752201 RepID=A0A479ZZT6_9CYAN|nr:MULTISPECIES: hypothetical protein [Sphaerospermopsis]MBD2135073.1 hypothetical protein [Sphaerospermopsis sp. FACHB-1094]MDB9441584.1 hypothetical protein [Sphaerospermopsis kisseleviana CS-549]BAZ83640.1 hypothetical protein NIES73_49290 [Sphaerospermopsis kisseleviana NIES-73]GCL38169.1 hypothetical protein SR1949_32830 [Sphaerospermopsis reniformis]